MLCPFKRVTTRLPSGQTNGQAFGLCSADNCMAYYEKDEYDTKPPFSVLGSRPACRLIELPYGRADSILLHIRLGRRRDKPGGAG